MMSLTCSAVQDEQADYLPSAKVVNLTSFNFRHFQKYFCMRIFAKLFFTLILEKLMT